MRINCAIIDDIKVQRHMNEETLKAVATEVGVNVEVSLFESAEHFESEISSRNSSFELVVSDIHMPARYLELPKMEHGGELVFDIVSKLKASDRRWNATQLIWHTAKSKSCFVELPAKKALQVRELHFENAWFYHNISAVPSGDQTEPLKENISEALSWIKRYRLPTIGLLERTSERWRRATADLEKIAESRANVLITGETGTGKEGVAKFIHTNSPRSNAIFVAVNCAAINENLLESELFGHEKGSFTGAVADKKGLFEIAHNGTLFLDEIGLLDISLQAKILRALQEKQIRRVGGTREIHVDVRVVVATNRNLLHMVEEERFRQDLYYRLNVLSIELPPLRDCSEDIIPLAEHLLYQKSIENGISGKSFSSEAVNWLAKYSFAGNVRELANLVERGVLLSEGEMISPNDMISDSLIKLKNEALSENTTAKAKKPFYEYEAHIKEWDGQGSWIEFVARRRNISRNAVDDFFSVRPKSKKYFVALAKESGSIWRSDDDVSKTQKLMRLREVELFTKPPRKKR